MNRRALPSLSALLFLLFALPARAQEIATLKPDGPVASTDCLAFSPDGKTLVVGSFFTIFRATGSNADGLMRLFTNPCAALSVIWRPLLQEGAVMPVKSP